MVPNQSKPIWSKIQIESLLGQIPVQIQKFQTDKGTEWDQTKMAQNLDQSNPSFVDVHMSTGSDTDLNFPVRSQIFKPIRYQYQIGPKFLD